MYKKSISLRSNVFCFTKGEYIYFFDKETLGIYPFICEAEACDGFFKAEKKEVYFGDKLLARIGITKMQGVDIEQSLKEELNQHEGYFYLCAKKNEIYSVQLEITERCNLNCVHCYNKNLCIRNELSLDKIKKIIDILETQKVVVLTLTGGEFFLHSQWKEILEYVSNKPFFVFIISNLTLLDSSAVQMISLEKSQIRKWMLNIYFF